MIRKLRIFLSSPGDVAAERQIAREIIESLNDDPFIKGQAIIEAVAWEAPGSRVLMPVSLTPQQAIDRNLAKPSETDAVVVLFWGRMGTPLDTDKHGTKPDGTQYQSGTEWEYWDAVNGAKEHAHNLPIVLLYRRTDDVLPPQQKDFSSINEYLEAVKEYANQLERVNGFFEQFRDPVTKAYRGNVLEYNSQDDFRQQFMQDARLLVKELLGMGDAQPLAKTSPQINWTGSPFPGLRAFTEKDEPIFFGRGYETADLIKRLSKHRLMFVIGASGSGKSSLVGAGVIPQLKRGALYGVAGWHIVRFTPGDDPFQRLSMALLRTLPALKDPLADDEERAKTVSATLRKSPEKLSQQVEKWLSDDPEGAEVLLFVDQFEELFTTTTPADGQLFADMLLHTSPQIRIIVTMRSDFYDRALPYFESVLRDASYTLGTPSPIALYEMIARPAEATGLSFDDGLAEDIVDKSTGQIGGLSLVAYLLEELYLLGEGKLTRAHYDALGGVEGAIGKRAETIFNDLDLPEKETILAHVFRELVTVNDKGVATRQRGDVSRFTDAEQQLIKAFVDGRLLVTDGDRVEVAHEAIFRSWERLTAWIEDTQEDLILLRQVKASAAEWNKNNRPDFLLWNQERLELVYAMRDRLQPELDNVVGAFIEPEQARLYRELGFDVHYVDGLTVDVTPSETIAETSHARRYAIGERLNDIGELRQGVGLKNGLPDMRWLSVERTDGLYEFKFGRFEVKPFLIAKYLVTNTQYQAFIESGDYDNKKWWEGFPPKYQPQGIENVRNGNLNAPRDTISWYQSVAYTRWLTAQLAGLELNHPSLGQLIMGDNAEIRLPTEWEWQWAAQAGTEKREYAWGDWDDYPRANTDAAGIQNRSTAVGMYPHGSAICGALDMTGNLREWCINDYGNPDIIDGFGNGKGKVLRCGSFNFNRNHARASYRNYNLPYGRNFDLGLRVLCAPINV